MLKRGGPMKRNVILRVSSLGIMACLLIAGCTVASEQKKFAATASANFSEQISSEPNHYTEKNINAGQVVEKSNSISDTAINPTIDEINQRSTTIIQGDIQSVSYVFIDGIAWTQVSVCVIDNLRGDLNVGDIVNVYYLGGYASTKDYINTYGTAHFSEQLDVSSNQFIEFVIDNEAHPQIGEDNLYFLVQTPKNSPLPQNAYERICGKYATFSVSDDGKTVIRDNPDSSETATFSNRNESESFNYDDLKKIISQH